MLRRATRARSSKADNWGNGRCFGVAVINESVVAGDLCKRTRNRAGDRVTGRPNPTSVKSSEGRDYLYRTQIEELQTSVMGKRALPNILTKALAASKSQVSFTSEGFYIPFRTDPWQTVSGQKPAPCPKQESAVGGPSSASDAETLTVYGFKKSLKYFPKTLDNSGES